MPDIEKLRDLLARVEAAEGEDSELDVLLLCALLAPTGAFVQQIRFNGAWCIYEASKRSWERPKGFRRDHQNVTGSIDAAVALVEKVLPGWLWRVATCSVSDDAWIMPDFCHPAYGPQLRERFPDECQRDPLGWLQTDIDRRPPGNPALALVEAILQALIVTEEKLGGALIAQQEAAHEL